VKDIISGLGNPHPAEVAVLNSNVMLLELLQLGIPYGTVMEMDEQEINELLGTHYAIEEKKAENNARR